MAPLSLFVSSWLLSFAVVNAKDASRRAASGVKGFKITGYTPAAFSEASPLVETSNVLSLTSKPGAGRSSKHLRAIQKGSVSAEDTYAVSDVFGLHSQYGAEYLTWIEVGDTWFEVAIDTGSSDTWLAETGYNCVNSLNLTFLPEYYCNLGPLYTISPTFTRIPDEYFNITYGGGEALTGIFGYERVTLANITVNRQQIAVVQNASWFGNGISSGILGLAFPSLTSAFEGNNPAVDTTSDASDGVEYSPILTTIFTQGEAAPLFTLVLERGNVTSTLAIGGLPPGLPTYKPDNFASAQIQILQVTSEPLTATQYSFYTIYPDGFVFKGANETTYSSGTWSNPLKGPPKGWKPMDKSIDTITTDFPMIIDSGTSLMYLPRNLTYTLLALYDPPGYPDPALEAYVVPCNATAPRIGVTIGGKAFWINPVDLIQDVGRENGLCNAGIQNGGEGPYILGDVFLTNVVAVFDVGAAEMRFAAHEHY